MPNTAMIVSHYFENQISVDRVAIKALENKLIHEDNDCSDLEKANMILNLYNNYIQEEKGMPDLLDIVSEVESYNYMILADIAEIQMTWDSVIASHKYDLADELWEFYFSDGETWNYVEDMLNELKLYYIFNEDHEIYSKYGDKVVIVANDCQNILFPQFFTKFYEELIDIVRNPAAVSIHELRK